MRKRTEAGSFDLFSDNASRIRHLSRVLTLIGAVVIILLVNAANMTRMYMENGQDTALFIAVACLAVALLGTIGFFRILKKRRALERESIVFE